MDMDNESIRVLLVEDNPGDAALIQQALSRKRMPLVSCQRMCSGSASSGLASRGDP